MRGGVDVEVVAVLLLIAILILMAYLLNNVGKFA